MSVFYLLGVLAVWTVLTVLIWKVWRCVRKGAAKLTGGDIFFAVVFAVWLAVSFWYGGGRKYYYDAEVKRLCAIDGGVKVYEKVTLPADRFDAFGTVRVPSKNKASIEDDYFYEVDAPMIRTGDLEIWELSFRIVRKSDGKILGTATSYARRGGDIPGPWHKSSFGCPPKSDVSDLKNKLFSR